MERVELAEAAAVLGAVAAPLLLLARTKLAFAAGLALLALAEAGLAFALIPDQLDALAASPARVGALVVGLAALAGVAALFARFPALVPAALLAVAPVRVHRGRPRRGGLPAPPALRRPRGECRWRSSSAWVRAPGCVPCRSSSRRPLGVFVAFAGLSLLWSSDPRRRLDRPALLPLSRRCSRSGGRPGAPHRLRLPQPRRGSLRLHGGGRGVGLWQAWTHTLFFADDLQASNAYTTFFRVTSIFADSSIYGRYLGLGIVVLFVLLWLNRIRPAVGLPLLALQLAGLYFAYSQSTYVGPLRGSAGRRPARGRLAQPPGRRRDGRSGRARRSRASSP